MDKNSKAYSEHIDWMDIRVGLLIGCLFAVIKGTSFLLPELHMGNLDAIIPFLLCVQYTIYRARQQPEKLDEWGITTPITRSAIIVMLVLSIAAIVCMAALAICLSGTLSFEFRYATKMVEYIISAFPQQFFLCSVILVSLSKISFFRGNWRLPLAVGFLFAIAHFWTPFHIPGTRIPLQLIGTFPMGFIAAWYFLKFRNILPLTLSHAILYVLLHHWVEVQL
jgi:membrane protease YdiL (CAAX protease family)